MTRRLPMRTVKLHGRHDAADQGASRPAGPVAVMPQPHAEGPNRVFDPTARERDFAVAEREFLAAMQAYKARSGRMFPTWSEVLEVLKELGYAKPDDATAPPPAAPESLRA
jgi:hypothetical protein